MGLPFSKELYPVRFLTEATGGRRPVAALELLLGQLGRGGATTAFIVIREGKWDIPRHFGARGPSGLELAYIVVPDSAGVPFSLDAAGRFLDDAIVLMGFPDVLVEPDDAYRPVVERLEAGPADAVVGLFPPVNPTVNDQVRLDGEGRVVDVAPKPVETPLDHAWGIAAWRPGFTRFLSERTRALLEAGRTLAEDGREYSVGHALADAVAHGLRVEGVHLDGGSFVDIGTPEGLGEALADGRADSLL